ncbi:Ribosomal RNA large subunit methyltransferase E [Penicillium expansum]|uniref:rRNA methyltransferase 2, mitochondrial n=1 Tax=Penicillium expansum TaxID=27334 RepID=A0A0A2JIU5_PENEN|nr:Ribosomal RNA large subunit methyltransferase E [Penicillium expansum]KGO49311.1 Ribosomal RNA large subunit methyltransferase E [Penicillium expansum]KGO52200.1 Ribosomal RNA large subunit methyltransferase E [Penicillium expansum]
MAMAQEACALDFEMSMRTMHLEKEYEKTLSDSARLLDGERDRVRRMELLLSKFENEALRSQLEEANGHLLGFTSADSEACAQLQEACQEIDHLELQAQASSSEINRLKEELSAQKNNLTSYNTVLAEKLHLSRNFSTLQSELEQLRAQNASYQAIISEKHEMERQISSLELQLDNEKHAHERTQAKGSQQMTEITQLSARVEELRNELAGKLRAKQQQERDNHNQNSAWANQRATFEGKIDSLKQQLRSTKDKLQEAQVEIQQRRSLKSHAVNESESSSRTVPLQRPGPSGHAGVTIATPGAVRVQEKLKRDSAVPGDKSAFSITPFLNRTGAPSDSPMSSVGDEDDILGDTDTPHGLLSKPSTFGEPRRIGSALRRQLSPTEDRLPITKSTKSRARDGAMPMSAPENEVKKPTYRLDRRVPPTETDELHEQFEHEHAKPKKRKLGGQRDRSLFEEEDEEEAHPTKKFGRKLAIGNGRASALGRLCSGVVVSEKVAASRTQPHGRVLGVDIIPAQPPKGVSTIQGNFLAPEIQTYIRDFLRSPDRGRPRQPGFLNDSSVSLLEPNPDIERTPKAEKTNMRGDKILERTVDVVLSDMSAPWHQTSGFWKRSLSAPYNRMMNTSGVSFRDHAGSMDLCHAALRFSSDVLKAGGHFVCKFYQGAEDKELEQQLKELFKKVHRLKPESSRSESKEAFFVGLERKS